MQAKKQPFVIFSSMLEELMQRKGITQAELAGHLNLTQAAVSNYLQGRIPKSATLLDLAAYFDVSVDYLLTGSSVPRKGEQEIVLSGTIPALDSPMKCTEKTSTAQSQPEVAGANRFPPFVHTAVADYYAIATIDVELARQVAEIISVYRKSVQKTKPPMS
jgi:DNA-binding XRE family transcriptional regulator